jgi:hypothetical protein
MELNKIAKIGIIGTGFVGLGLKRTINLMTDMTVSSVLTQRKLNDFLMKMFIQILFKSLLRKVIWWLNVMVIRFMQRMSFAG